MNYYVTLGEAAKALGYSNKWMRERIMNQIPGVIRRGNGKRSQYRIPIAGLQEWERHNRVTPIEKPSVAGRESLDSRLRGNDNTREQDSAQMGNVKSLVEEP